MSKKNKGICCIIASAFCFALMNIFVRMSGDLPSVEKSFFRNFVAMIFAAAILIRNRIPFKIGKGNYMPMFFRAFFGTIGILCNFYAVDHLLVADASMLNKLSPFFAIIFSIIILKEIPKKYQVGCLIMALVGCLFVVKPGFASTDMAGMAAGVCGGMAAGLAYTMVRVLGSKGVKGPVIVFCFSCFSCLATLPLIILFYHSPMSAGQVLTLLGAGLAAAGGQFSITAAYTYAPAKEISVYDYTQIIFSTIMGYLFFQQVPDVLSFIGYAVICGASVIMFIMNQK
ncbi:MAG: DMT family transporter [Lachnospiraceae bacterium]|nr:DMT family transporter [Lachnospiraceae bacterium]